MTIRSRAALLFRTTLLARTAFTAATPLAILTCFLVGSPVTAQTPQDLASQFQPTLLQTGLNENPYYVEYFNGLTDVNGDGVVDFVTLGNFSNSRFPPYFEETVIGVSNGDNSKVPFSDFQSPTGWRISSETQTFDDYSPPLSVFLQDVNTDGYPDFVLVGSGIVEVSYNTNSVPQFATPVAQGTFSNLIRNFTDVADIDSDGDLDILFTSNDTSGNRLYYLRNAGNSGAFGPFDDASLLSAVNLAQTGRFAVGDLDKDGTLDIVASGVDRDFYLLNTGQAQPFAGATPVFLDEINAGVGTALRLVDLNADTHLDLVSIGGEDTRSSYVLSRGPGDLLQNSPKRYLSPGAQPIVDMLFEDFDADGDKDLLYVSKLSFSNGSTFLKLNSGSSVPFSASNIGIPIGLSDERRTTGIRFIGAADLDGDDDIDYIMDEAPLLRSGNARSLYLNNRFSGTPMPVVTVEGSGERIDEDAGFFELTLRLDRPADQTVSVEFSTRPGTALPREDFYGVFRRVEFLPGEQVKSVRVQILDDGAPEADEYFSWYLSFADGANLSQRSGTVIINGLLELSLRGAPVARESSGKLTFEFMLNEPAFRTIRFAVATDPSASEATPGLDFFGAYRVLEIPAGEQSATFSVTIRKDDIVEGDEQLALRVFNIENARLTTESVVGNIRDDEENSYIQINAQTRLEGGLAEAYIAVFPDPVVPVSVRYATREKTAKPGVDYYGTSGIVTFQPGERFKTVYVQTIDNTAIDGRRAVTVRLYRPENGTIIKSEADITIIDND